MKMIGAPHGLQDGLNPPFSQVFIYSFVFLPLLTQLQTFYISICSEVQHWEEVQYDALYLFPLACLVDQRYHGTLKLICPIWKGFGCLHPLSPHCGQSPPW